MIFLNFFWVKMEFEMYKIGLGIDSGFVGIYIDIYLIILFNNFILIFDFRIN